MGQRSASASSVLSAVHCKRHQCCGNMLLSQYLDTGPGVGLHCESSPNSSSLEYWIVSIQVFPANITLFYIVQDSGLDLPTHGALMKVLKYWNFGILEYWSTCFDAMLLMLWHIKVQTLVHT